MLPPARDDLVLTVTCLLALLPQGKSAERCDREAARVQRVAIKTQEDLVGEACFKSEAPAAEGFSPAYTQRNVQGTAVAQPNQTRTGRMLT